MAFALRHSLQSLPRSPPKCHLTQGLRLQHWDFQEKKKVEEEGSAEGLVEGSKKLPGANKDLLMRPKVPPVQ